MNSQAVAVGASCNIFFFSSAGGQVVPTMLTFISYTPARYLRPFDLFPPFRSGSGD